MPEANEKPTFFETIDKIDEVLADANTPVEAPPHPAETPEQRIANLEAHNAHLRRMLDMKLEDAMAVWGMEPNDDGSIDVLLRCPLFTMFTHVLAELFDRSGATNYVEQTLHSQKTGDLVLTVRRYDGKTPNQMQREAEAKTIELAEAAAAFLNAPFGSRAERQTSCRLKEILDSLPENLKPKSEEKKASNPANP